MAFEELEAFPALAESRDRLLTVISKDHVATADVVSAVESDVALIIAVLRIANQAQAGRGRVDTVVGGAGRRTYGGTTWCPRAFWNTSMYTHPPRLAVRTFAVARLG